MGFKVVKQVGAIQVIRDRGKWRTLTEGKYKSYPIASEKRAIYVAANVSTKLYNTPACAKCGEPLSLPLRGFAEDEAITDACYCVGCRPEPEKQGLLKLEGRP